MRLLNESCSGVGVEVACWEVTWDCSVLWVAHWYQGISALLYHIGGLVSGALYLGRRAQSVGADQRSWGV